MAEERPAPAYGEYAPEGWEWKPDQGGEQRQGEGSLASSGQPPVSTPGVPHNLGVGVERPARGAAPGPQAPNEQGAYRAPAPGPLPAPQGDGRRTGDRIVTIILLVLGGTGALWWAATLYQMPASFEIMAAAFEIDGFVLPDSVRTISTIGALIVLAVYALNLIISIQRLRRRKLTFWVPLVAAVVAFIVVFAVVSIASSQLPELMTAFSDPDALNRILDYVSAGNTAQ